MNLTEDATLLAKFQNEKEKGWVHIKEGGLEALHNKVVQLFLACCALVFCCCLISHCMNKLNITLDEKGVFHFNH